MSARRWIIVVALCGAACGTPESPRKLEPRPVEPAKPTPPSAPANDPAAIAASREHVAGPAADASADERRAAVLELLTNGSAVEHLPVDFGDRPN